MSHIGIPSIANGRALVATQADISATRTFPNLSSLTKDAGDLLVAICVTYLAGTNPQFSGWTGGFTEVYDSGTGTTMGIGVATKVSTGSETGTIAVTQAGGTITGHAAMILLSIPGALVTSNPEFGTQVANTTAAADPGAVTPSWGVEDTLWAVIGGAGETSTTGSFTGITAAPTNYGNMVDSGISADVLGGCQAVIAFRVMSAASDDPGAFTVDTSAARNSAVAMAIRSKPFEGWGIEL